MVRICVMSLENQKTFANFRNRLWAGKVSEITCQNCVPQFSRGIQVLHTSINTTLKFSVYPSDLHYTTGVYITL
jgi:hypothetical protein